MILIKIEGTRREGRRLKQLLNDLKEKNEVQEFETEDTGLQSVGTRWIISIKFKLI